MEVLSTEFCSDFTFYNCEFNENLNDYFSIIIIWLFFFINNHSLNISKPTKES
jgi:hypothetical protein